MRTCNSFRIKPDMNRQENENLKSATVDDYQRTLDEVI